ncbi:MAG: cytidine deaminase [Actinobacteria bacterium]|jgi:cytidine deaminase|uniref:cytidine deaminase n=1 Tax=freshwater metagenome TaxID=449393 RepID=A0A6J6DVZ4_9ZZZZ|nr:cytidine deaminase [Actinomycetota bacterium]MSZ13481.1 cytidine deaminase [Actinomycetota bacterium]MSZ28604.1 cytidine deaminase [Actinomycetota bacterium]MSZ35216.1 cytidine deaminase [Actinomycetota bacterium]MTA86954.1 cytidine deaminase [Actinomycetota bacterium]
MSAIDWDQLHKEAIAAMKTAYAPYSKFPVGVSALVNDGRIVKGCNVENASYGVGLCAECGLVSNLISSGGGRLVAIVCVDGQGDYLAPCGRCRQLLYEHGGPDALLMTDDGPQKMSVMLPWAFGPDDLDRNER